MWYRRAQNISPIYIRLLKEEDAEDIYAIYANQNVTRYTNWSGLHISYGLIKSFVRECLDLYENMERITYCLEHEDKVVGLVFLHNLNVHPGWAEVGAMLSEEYWNQGIMSKVLNNVFQKSSYDKFYAVIDLKNNPSLALFAKLGFRFDPSFPLEEENITLSFIRSH
jgi:ribosomal-protein-alanine N-acetyltransferase